MLARRHHEYLVGVWAEDQGDGDLSGRFGHLGRIRVMVVVSCGGRPG
jgi:hypothetical protein